MSIFKKPYEISLWEDRLTFVDNNLKEYELFIPEGVKIATSYYRERKICVIGSNTFEAPIRAINPQLKRNINGSNTLTFSLYSKYYDENQEEFVENPFLKYLTNERKVKLKYEEKGEEKWLDFIIKNISENSETYLYSYTATDLFINELSKTGFNLVFDEKQNNNIGTVNELGERVLEGTDWRIGENSEIIKQTQQEALYKIVLNKDIEAKEIETNNTVKIKAGSEIYTFYSCLANKRKDFFQFLFNQNGQYLVDEKRIIINATEYYCQPFIWEENKQWPPFADNVEYTNSFRGERSNRQQNQVFDKILQRYVSVYENNGQEIYGYTDNNYINADLVRSYITNPIGFETTSGWKQKTAKPLELKLFPSYEEKQGFQYERLSTLKYSQEADNFLINTGISDNASFIKEFIQNEQYIFRLNCQCYNSEKKELFYPDCAFKVQIKTYNFDSNGQIVDDAEQVVLFEGNTGRKRDQLGQFSCKISCKTSISNKLLNDKKIGIFIQAIDENGNFKQGDFYIIEANFYKFLKDGNGNESLPGGKIIETLKNGEVVIKEDFKSYVETVYYYYLPNQKITEKNEIEYLYIGKENKNYQPKYNENYEKIRSISASGSNRFNLLQKLSETFECWCRFDVKHKANGEIALIKDLYKEIIYDAGNSQDNITNFIDAGTAKDDYAVIDAKNLTIESLYHPQKFISFHKNIGQTNNVDIIYGINLKSIVRTVESNNIVTKLTVKTNNNKFAPLGGCDISRAKENPTGGNVLYDFSQYIAQGLLDENNFNNDLYSFNTERGWLGFYTKLKNLNSKIQKIEENKNALLKSKTNIFSQFTEYKAIFEQGAIILREAEEEFYDETKYNIDSIPSDAIYLQQKEIIALGEDILRLRIQNQQNEYNYLLAKKELEKVESEIKKLENENSILLKQKEELITFFENKYSRFIQEAPWTSEDYVDDELYYLDAESTLHNSAQPKVQYTINIIDISPLENYECFSYSLGDVTHIQDTDFFGWININNIKTPYREKIVVTETTTNFDSPEKDTIKVQNYRTQFEDLFQRITAATQQIEFYSGAYERASSVVKPDGSIAPEALASAFSSNTHALQNINNQSVKWDDKGITTTSLINPAEIVRVVSGGIFISNDGGNTWSTGITGNGINAKIITTGQLNTGLITILNGDQPAFRWDAKGINAYKQEADGRYNSRTYVRFDQFGIYGIRNGENAPKDINAIWDNASFSLTWRGFKLKTGKDGKGSVIIDTENDFAVFDQNNEKIIQIGRIEMPPETIEGAAPQVILDNKIDYGIVIIDPTAEVKDQRVFEANQRGLSIGGWKITKNSFASPDLSADGQPEIAIYSKPVKMQTGLSGELEPSWRILARDDEVNFSSDANDVNFGLDTKGRIYAKGLFIQGETSINGKIEKPEGGTQEIKIDLTGITVIDYDNDSNTGSSPSIEKTITWWELLSKLAVEN